MSPLGDDALSRAVVIDPRAVADRHPDATRQSAGDAGRTGHRASVVADAGGPRSRPRCRPRRLRASSTPSSSRRSSAISTGSPTRWASTWTTPTRFGAPHVEPATPPYLWPSSPPDPHRPRAIDLASRAGATELATAWQRCALERDAPLTREQRTLIAAAVAERLGDRSVTSRVPPAPVDRALVDLADLVTLAPWRLGPAAYNPSANSASPTTGRCSTLSPPLRQVACSRGSGWRSPASRAERQASPRDA